MTLAKRISPLALILLVGMLLRFWQLELKPLWMDEVITALFGFGRNYYDVPLEQAVPVSALGSIFTLNPNATCAQITQTVAVQSVHPPLFFCWMHSWLTWVQRLPLSQVWQLRALPALFGVLAIAAIYQLNTLAFSRSAGLTAASVMAVSPFAVYLSQEARHYTVPMVLVILALTGLNQLLLDLRQRQFHLLAWLGWIAVNSLGFYVHYFFLLAFVAQAVILVSAGMLGQELGGRRQEAEGRSQKLETKFSPYAAERSHGSLLPTPYSLLPLLAIALVCLTYLPWIPTLLSHMDRPETDWVKVNVPGVFAAIAPLFQIVSGWTLATIALPVEGQPLAVAVGLGSLMAIFSGWLVWRVGQGLWQLAQHPAARWGVWMLLLFTVLVMLEFLAIAYLLGKDFTQVPRYNFIYFPGLCALIGAGLSQPPATNKNSGTSPPLLNPIVRAIAQGRKFCDRHAVLLVLGVATLSSVLVISNQVFQKPYQPDQVARNLRFEPSQPILVTMAYSDFQDVALGLSFGLELARQAATMPQATEPQFAFLGQFKGYEGVWQTLSVLPQPLLFPLNLWVISPGLKRVGYRQELTLSSPEGRSHTCTIDPNHHYRIGIPYQLYRCQ
jgi:uncharacterized membrane protein